MKKYLFVLLLCTTFVAGSYAQLVLNTSVTPLQLANAIVGQGVSVSNATFTGDTTMAAFFTATSTNLGLDSGVMLATGDVHFAIGPNIHAGAGDSMGFPGDSILSVLADTNTFDAAVLEFDFVPQNSVFGFSYVFGSEEYPEYVCSTFNDVFAFMISGPGITGLKNIALIPGTSVPVAINAVNGGVIGSNGFPGPHCGLSYATLYVNNTSGQSIELDGFTVPLVADITLQPLMTYHLKIMIADAGDAFYDSGVFIRQTNLGTGLRNVNNDINLSLFPNPAKDKIYFSGKFSVEKNNRIRIFDTYGKVIMNYLIDDNNSFDVSSLNNGIYYAEFTTSDQQVVYRKFVKE